jgi:2-polyprenyl-3-methyl-5-hydroxy-6-metoxy-1,4-benzoquinol methylase
MNLSHRSYQKEILDNDDVSFEDIKRNMQELNFINTWLGGHAISIKGLKQLVGGKKQITVCEIGCGGGDNIKALDNWCKVKNIDANFIGIDIKQECIDFAATALTNIEVLLIASDYKKAFLPARPDVVFSSLFCHHFTESELVEQLQWMQNNSTIGFFINDLQRNTIGYHSIKLLTAVFSSSYLVKNDAPLSVARGFRKNEWMNIFAAAGIHNYSVKWQWAFRYLIVSKHGR